MPEVFRRRVADRSVREALYLARTEFLPEEIREDKNANWVLSFDELRTRPSQGERFSERPNDSSLWILDLIVTSTLQRRMPYFFAALFHIGRQWKVSESALRSLEKASDQKNVDDTLRLTLNSLRELASSDKQVAELYDREGRDTAEALSLLLKSSGEQHVGRLREAQRWWGVWSEEVNVLRNRIARLQEFGFQEGGYRLSREVVAFLSEGYRPSRLRETLEGTGVRFGSEIERSTAPWPIVYSEMLTPLVLLSLTEGGKGPFFHEFIFEWRHIIHDLRRESEYGELRRTALERLKQKYRHGEDPFEPYLPLVKPVTEALRNLVIEHELPGSQSSPWLDAWQRCIEYNPAAALSVPFKGIPDRERIKAFARDADSAIKHELPDQYLPGESWDDFVQRLFESAWVSSIADQIVNTSKQDPAAKWTFDFFASVVEAVVKNLNEIGYSLVSPSTTRLKKLWERLHSDKPYSTDQW
jgi:hypothetical protein